MVGGHPVLDRLRAATAAAHRQLDNGLDAVERFTALASRREMAPRYYRMHALAEAALAPWLGSMEALDLEGRSRVAVLADDLRALDVAPPALSDEERPPLNSAPEAVGFFYVIEGSTLGGRMIRQALLSRGSDLVGLGFLDPYGPLTGIRWRDFLMVLERVGEGRIAEIERGAVLGFEHARSCLLSPEAAA